MNAPNTNPSDHDRLIVDQFTKQAAGFSTAPAIANEEALELLVRLSGAGPDDTVLDVACGPGFVVCAFARRVRHAAGIDVTPAMIERARAEQQQKGLSNVSWHIGGVAPLPYPDASFSIVASRYAFHHFENPRAVIAEMCEEDGDSERKNSGARLPSDESLTRPSLPNRAIRSDTYQPSEVARTAENSPGAPTSLTKLLLASGPQCPVAFYT